jgi:hypothetical protein
MSVQRAVNCIHTAFNNSKQLRCTFFIQHLITEIREGTLNLVKYDTYLLPAMNRKCQTRVKQHQDKHTHCASLIVGLCMALQYMEKQSYLTFKPSTFGKRFSSGTSTSSIWIIPVLDIRKENFPSILGVSSPFDFLSTINPLTLSSSQTAQIIHKSAIGAFVIL